MSNDKRKSQLKEIPFGNSGESHSANPAGPQIENIPNVYRKFDPSRINFDADPGKPKRLRGNYLLTLGAPASGKSTLQHFLISELQRDTKVQLGLSATATDQPDHNRLISAILSDNAHDLLPARNLRGKFQEFMFSICPQYGIEVPLRLLEFSGEDLNSFRAESNLEETLPDQIANRLKAPKNRLALIFVSDADAAANSEFNRADEDFFFDAVFDYLDTHRKRKRLDVLFLVAKWDLIDDKFDHVEDYLKKVLPNTLARVRNSRGRIRAKFMHHSIGDVVKEDTQLVTPTYRLVDRRTEDTRMVLSWIYWTFSGGSFLANFPAVDETPLQRFLGYLMR